MNSRQDGGKQAQLTGLLRIVHEEVNRLTSRLPNHAYEREELVSCAVIGLCEARHRFEAEKGVPLSAYARLRIRGALIDAMRKSQGIVPRRYFEQFMRHQRDAPSPESLRQHVAHLKRDIARSYSVDSLPMSADERLIENERSGAVHRAIEALDDRSKLVIKGLFGFDGCEETGESLAKSLGCHRSSISRQRRKILRQMKQHLMEQEGVGCADEMKSMRRPESGHALMTQAKTERRLFRRFGRESHGGSRAQGKTPRSL